jgi:DNA-binding response OmpR family regulator
MLTDRGMIGDLDQAFEIGADDYITKSSDMTQLGKIVKTKWGKYTKSVNVR